LKTCSRMQPTLNNLSQPLSTGWPQTASDSTQTRPSWYRLVPSTICWRFLAAVLLWRSASQHQVIRRRSCAWSAAAHSKLVAGQARHLIQCKVLFPDATTTTYPTPSSHWFTRSSSTASTTVSVYWPARSPLKTTAKLQRVLNAAVRVVSNCGKYDRRPTHFRCHVLHWLDVTDRIRFRLCVQVYKCQHSVAPGYLVVLCRPVSSIDSHKHLRSANRGQLQVPRISMSTYGSRAFGHAGPSTRNAFPNISKCSTHSLPTFGRHL